LLVVATAYLYLNLFVLPHTPILLTGDQTYFWTDAQRMLFGELPYRDFFQFTPPGTDVLYFVLFRIFGTQIWVTNFVVLVLGLALCCVCQSIARQIMARGPAFLASLLFLVLIYGKLRNATHHWFSLLLILCAVRILMTGVSWLSLILTGTLLGAAAFFTHTHAIGALFAFILLLAWKQWREGLPLRFFVQRIVLLTITFAATWLLCLLPFLITIGAKQLWYYQFTFVRQYMGHTEGAFLGLPEAITLRRLPQLVQYMAVYALVFITCPLSLWQCLRRREDDDHLWDKIALLSTLGLLLTIEVMFSLSWLRVYVVALPAVVLSIFWLQRVRARNTLKIIWAATIVFALGQTALKFCHHYVIIDLPAGRAALSAITNEKFSWILQHTHPGQFFLEAQQPTSYFPLGLRSPVYAEGLTQLPQTRPEFVQLVTRQIASKPVPYILWSHHLDKQNGSSASDVLTPFRAWLQDNYRVAQVFSDGDEIWERK
jgi:hypothetical protein